MTPSRPIVRRPSRSPIVALTIAALAACSHSEPFTAPDSDSDTPFVDSEPARLTYADGGETEPAWLPDGRAFVYTYDRAGALEGDRCLTTMTATGGTIEREFCNDTPRDDLLTDVYASPSISTDSTLAFFYSGTEGAGGSADRGLFVAPYQDPGAKTLIRGVPFTGPTGTFYSGIGSISWLGQERIAFIGLADETIIPCPGCDPQAVRYGRDALVISPADPGSLAVIPDMAFPTSLAAGETADVVYYTLAGDSRIYRRILSSGATSTVYDFGGVGLVRDVHYAAGRVAAIVGGPVSVFSGPPFPGPIQTTAPGLLFLVDVTDGTARLIAGQLPAYDGDPTAILYQNPAISPDGIVLVVEADGFTSPGGNLWRFRLQ